jgi:hypothetical protein
VGPPLPGPSAECAADGLHDKPAPAAAWLAAEVSLIFDRACLAVLHYGSRAQGRSIRSDSAFDFFVIVTEYGAAYSAAARHGSCRRPRLAARAARSLPPNSLALRRTGPFGRQEAKCLVLSREDFARTCSRQARDHFVQTRLAQRIVLAWSRDPECERSVVDTVRAARERTGEWVLSFLPECFDLSDYCRAVIRVPFAHELRPEPRDHPETLFQAQRQPMLAIYRPVLARLEAAGTLRSLNGVYHHRRPSLATRLRARAYFQWSLGRTTLRLLKQPFLYDGWFGYLVAKIGRSRHVRDRAGGGG